MEKYNLKQIFGPDSKGFDVYKTTFDLLISVMHPELYEYLVNFIYFCFTF